MHLGPLNRKARLLASNPAVGTGGAVSEAPTHLKWLAVTVGEIDRPRALQAMRDGFEQRIELTSRFYREVVVGCFVDFENVRYRVARVRVLGRSEGLVIYGEA